MSLMSSIAGGGPSVTDTSSKIVQLCGKLVKYSPQSQRTLSDGWAGGAAGEWAGIQSGRSQNCNVTIGTSLLVTLGMFSY